MISLFIDPGWKNLGVVLAECTPPSVKTGDRVVTLLHHDVVALPGFASGQTSLTDPATSAWLASNWWRECYPVHDESVNVSNRKVEVVVIEDAHEAPVRQLVTALITGAYMTFPGVTVHLVRASTVKAKWKLGLHGHEANKKVAVEFVTSRWPELADGIGRSDHTCDALLTGLVGLYKNTCWDVKVIAQPPDMPFATTEDEDTEIYLTHNSRAPKQCWHRDCNAHKKPEHKPNKFFQSGPYMKDGEEKIPESAGSVILKCGGGKFNPGCGEALIVCFENGEFSDMVDEKIKEGTMRDGWVEEMRSAFSEPSKEWHRFHKRTTKRPAEEAPEDEPNAKVQATPEMAQLMAVINTLAQQVTTVNAQVALLTSKMESTPTASSSE